jgi:hypothetical protein
MATNDNPFGPGMSDFGLLSEVSGDVLGSPQKVAELQTQLSQLQSTLSQAPPRQNSMLEAGIRAALGAASAPDIFVDPLTGEETAGPAKQGGFVQGLLSGAAGAIEGQQADALARYEQEQARAREVEAQRSQLAAGVRALLAQNPTALEALGSTEAGRRTIGMLAFGVDTPVDPMAKSRERDESILAKQRMDYYNDLLRQPLTPGKRSEVLNAMRDMVDPDGSLGFVADDIVTGAPKAIKLSEMARIYGDPGARAWTQLQTTGDYPAFLATLAGLRVMEKPKGGEEARPTRNTIMVDLAAKLGEIQQAAKQIGDAIDMDAASKQLSEADQILYQKYLAPKEGPSLMEYFNAYSRAYDDVPAEIRQVDPQEAAAVARNLVRNRMREAGKARDVAARDTRKVVTPPPPDKSALNIDQWKALVRKRKAKDGSDAAAANKALVEEYIRLGKGGQIPALARQQAGM